MAAEITNIFHAVGMLRGDLAAPAFLGNIGFLAAVVRVSPGVYTLTTEIPVDFGEALCLANTPSPGRASAQVTADGSIEVRCTVDGVATDLSQIAIAVLRYRNGEVAIPPDPPFPSGAGLPTALVGYGTDVVYTDVYVRAADGDDSNPGTALLPFATLERAVTEVQRANGAARIHCGSGDYAWAILRNLYGPIVIVGDGGGDPADDALTELQASAAAAAGTGALLIAGVFGGGAFDGKVVEILSGAAAGTRRVIEETQVGGLVPSRAWVDAIPAPGDLYRVVESAFVTNGWPTSQAAIANCGAVDRKLVDTANPIAAVPDTNLQQQGIYLVNMMIDGELGAAQPIIRDSNVFLYGVEGSESARFEMSNSMLFVGTDDSNNGFANNIAGALGISRDAYAGYGAFFDMAANGVAYALNASGLIGYVVQLEQQLIARAESYALVMGARIRKITATDGGRIVLNNVSAPGVVIGLGGTADPVFADTGGEIEFLTGATIDGTDNGLRATQGGVIYALGGLDVTGTNNAANASQNGHILLRGDPAGGGWAGTAAFRVSASETALVAAFAALDGTLAAAVGNDSVITRVS